MPIRMLRAADIRRHIAEQAADIVNRDVDHLLDLLGDVGPSGLPVSGTETAWRLNSYHGTPRDNEAIERAVAIVQRSHPFMDPR